MQLIFGEDRANLEGNIFAYAIFSSIRCGMFMPAMTAALLNHYSYIYEKCSRHKLLRVYWLRLRPKCSLFARKKLYWQHEIIFYVVPTALPLGRVRVDDLGGSSTGLSCYAR
jgi:hypothetical protein